MAFHRVALIGPLIILVVAQLFAPCNAAAVPPPLPTPPNVPTFVKPALSGEGVWHPAGRLVSGAAAVYTTVLRIPDKPTVHAGLAWMDMRRLHARLYSGSLSPGGYGWRLTAPISPSASRTLVAAFNGGFLLKDSKGGYFSEGRLVKALVPGAASLVIFRNGRATVGAWNQDVGMSPTVAAVRQNLTLIVDRGHVVPGLNASDILTWGLSLYHNADAWRSGLGVTREGALVYVVGPMSIVDLASMLMRAGAVRAMTLDMNPLWPIFAVYSPNLAHGPATPANGRDLLSTLIQTPARFFERTYARDFITMSSS